MARRRKPANSLAERIGALEANAWESEALIIRRFGLEVDWARIADVMISGEGLESSNYDPLVAGWKIDGDGNAEFNTIVVRGDIISSNWDGADPANLTSAPDGTATLGFYLDSSAGAAQFMGAVYLGDELEISGDAIRFGPSQEATITWSTDLLDIDAANIIIGESITGEHIQVFNGNINVVPDPGSGTGKGISIGNLTSAENGAMRSDSYRHIHRYLSNGSTVIAGDENYYDSFNIDITDNVRYVGADFGPGPYLYNILRGKGDARYTVDPQVDTTGHPPEVDVYLNDATYGLNTYIYGRTYFANGGETTPSISWQSDTNTGLYHVGENNPAMSTAGRNQDWHNNGGTMQARFSNGGFLKPSITFISDPDTGFYRVGTNAIGIACGGVLAGYWDANGNLNGAQVGSDMVLYNMDYVRANGYWFVSSTNSGIDHSGSYTRLREGGADVISGNGSTEVYLGGMQSSGGSGDLRYTGSRIQFLASSKRFKKYIHKENFDAARLSLIDGWQSSSFLYKTDHKDDKRHLYAIAEDVQAALGDEYTTYYEDEIHNIERDAVITLMVENIKDLRQRVAELEAAA